MMMNLLGEITFLMLWLLNSIQWIIVEDKYDKHFYSASALFCLAVFYILTKIDKSKSE